MPLKWIKYLVFDDITKQNSIKTEPKHTFHPFKPFFKSFERFEWHIYRLKLHRYITDNFAQFPNSKLKYQPERRKHPQLSWKPATFINQTFCRFVCYTIRTQIKDCDINSTFLIFILNVCTMISELFCNAA